jgi:hypothetical protein
MATASPGTLDSDSGISPTKRNRSGVGFLTEAAQTQKKIKRSTYVCQWDNCEEKFDDVSKLR